LAGVERLSVERIVGALDAAGARYLIVGGLAVAAHGYVRFTADIDIVLDPAPAALRAAVEALRGLDYRPRAPVAIEEFADPEKRARWTQEKGLTVFSLFSDRHPATEIDLFVEPPFDFDSAYSRAKRFELAPGLQATFVGLADLLDMKRTAGRPQDQQDLEALLTLPPPEGDAHE
jgi:hypothetical protein